MLPCMMTDIKSDAELNSCSRHFWMEVLMTVRDVLRKAGCSCSIQMNGGNVWLLTVKYCRSKQSEGVCVMLCWNEQKGEAEQLLRWHLCWVIGPRSGTNKAQIFFSVDRDLLSLSRAVTELFTSSTSPFLTSCPKSSILLVTCFSLGFMTQVVHFIWICVRGLAEPMVRLSVLTSLVFACEERLTKLFLDHCSFMQYKSHSQLQQRIVPHQQILKHLPTAWSSSHHTQKRENIWDKKENFWSLRQLALVKMQCRTFCI